MVVSSRVNIVQKRYFPGFRIRKVGTRRIYNLEESNSIVRQSISDAKPFLLSRFGTTELDFLVSAQAEEKSNYAPNEFARSLNILSGVYPSDAEHLRQFRALYVEASTQIDVLAVRDGPLDAWHRETQELGVELLAKKAPLVSWDVLFPIRAKLPWTQWLEGNSVLVIHPFVETIKHQLPKLSQIHGRDIFCGANFHLYRPPQLLADSHERNEWASWQDAFVAVTRDIDRLEFDVALVAAGAMGLPIAAHIKKRGKVALHIGGDLQLFFGIKGARWLRFYPKIQRRMNQFWVFPAESDRPQGFKRVEKGGYW